MLLIAAEPYVYDPLLQNNHLIDFPSDVIFHPRLNALYQYQ